MSSSSSASFSFAVFGDWGQAYDNSSNVDQANVMHQLAQSGSRFAVMTGDTAYQSGSQTAYGDLQQTGTDVSAVFAPSFWGVPGRSIPVFNVTGNHGFTNGSVQVVNWPETKAASTSNGKYVMEPYPSINGSTPTNYPSMWYAFDAGPARFYVLTVAWSDSNIGTGVAVPKRPRRPLEDVERRVPLAAERSGRPSELTEVRVLALPALRRLCVPAGRRLVAGW